MKKWTSQAVCALKGKEKITCLTAYDCLMARAMDRCGIHIILVGDSLGMTVLGHDTTLPVTEEDMLRHTGAVARATESALVVGDMPFMSFQVSPEHALENAGRFLKEAGADAVKLEGGRIRAATIARIVGNGIPVMGHIGLTPQSVRQTGGYRVQGRDPKQAQSLKDDALALAEAGVFAIVLECIPSALAAEITAMVSAPTIGIGAGLDCDGQVLVAHDMLGLTDQIAPRFVKRYAEMGETMTAAFQAYIRDVQSGAFPSEEHGYGG